MAKNRVVYEYLKDGEWFKPTKRNQLICCCDCNLVHRIDSRIVEGVLEARYFRDDRRTSALRRKKKAGA